MLLTQKIKDIQEYKKHFGNVFKERHEVENYIASCNHNKAFHIIGHCLVCAKPSAFNINWTYSNGIIPNYREHLICEYCQLNNRQRFLLHYCEKIIDEKSDIYLYERVTPFYDSFVKRNKGLNIIGSEYLGIDITSGKEINNIRHEDALQLSLYHPNHLNDILR